MLWTILQQPGQRAKSGSRSVSGFLREVYEKDGFALEMVKKFKAGNIIKEI